MSPAPLAPDEVEAALVEAYGFVPNFFRIQSELPGAVAAEAQLLRTIQDSEGKLTRAQKDLILSGLAHSSDHEYFHNLYSQTVPTPEVYDRVLLSFSLKLALQGPWVSGKDVENLTKAGFDDAAILESIATTALSQMLWTLAEGLQPKRDSQPAQFVQRKIDPPHKPPEEWVQAPGPYLRTVPLATGDFQPFLLLREQMGFVPNLFCAQMLRPDLVEAEVHALDRILFAEDVLSRVQKEKILLVISAANLNTYFVAVHSQILNALGVPLEECDQIIEDPSTVPHSEEDKVLLAEVRKLSRSPVRPESQFDRDALRKLGFTELQIIETVVMAGLANFLNTVQFGLGSVPDFPPRRVFTPKDLYPVAGKFRPTLETAPVVDPDSALVAAVQDGDVDRFEELVRRHSRHIFSTLAGIVGDIDDAHDATQDVFLKAFEKIGGFEGRSKFSTWLMSIAINTGTEILRRRKTVEPLESEDYDDFRPRQLQSWTADPEQLFSAAQRDELVREAILRLPEKYRVALLLRDINQLSTEDAAAVLQLGVPAMKARILRGRLMLRESLAPYFGHTGESADD